MHAFYILALCLCIFLGAVNNAEALSVWQRQVKALIRKDKVAMRQLKGRCATSKISVKSDSFCDADGDGITNFRESHLPRKGSKRIKTNFKKADTDGDGVSDYDEIVKYGTNPLVPDSKHKPDSNCGKLNFDSNGNTSQFGIPPGLSGNKARGENVYKMRCQACHPAADHGINYSYTQIKASITGATGMPMKIQLPEQDLSDLTAWLNQSQLGGRSCDPKPTPTPETPQPPTPPNPNPTPPTCIGSGTPNFDSMGNTTAFGIHAPNVGNISAGQSVYKAVCTGCHLPANGDKGLGYSFDQLKAAFSSNQFMNGTLGGPVIVDDAQVANLIAYLHQADTIDCQANPTPTPTPDPVAQGAAIFSASCVRCHSISNTGSVREISRHPSLSKLHSALWNGPDEMPQFRGLTIGQQAPPYSESENALWYYLGSLP